MSNHYEWGAANTGRYQVVAREAALDAWCVDEAEAASSVSHVLGVFNFDGDGTVLEGSPEDILDYVDRLHAYVHCELDDTVDREERACAGCGDHVLILSSRDWCDACEAVTIPGEVWTAFLAQEYQLDLDHPGDVTLSAVVGELRRLMQEHTLTDP